MLQTLFDHFSSLPKIVQWSTDVTARVVDKLLRRKAYVKKKVSDLLFDGFSDIFLDTLRYPKKGLEYAIPSLRNIPDRFYGYFPVIIIVSLFTPPPRVSISKFDECKFFRKKMVLRSMF